MNAHTSLNVATGTPSSNLSISCPLTNDDAFQFLTTSIGDPMVHINNVSSFTDEHNFYQQPQQPSASIEQVLPQRQHDGILSQPVHRLKSVNQYVANMTKIDNELTPSLSPNSTNSTPLLSQDNTNLRDPPLSSNMLSIHLSESSLALDLHQNHHENTSILYAVSGPLETTANDQQHAIHFSAGQGPPSAPTDMKTDHATNSERYGQTELYHSQYHQLQQYISSDGGSALNSQMLASDTSSSQETNKDHAASVNQSNPSNQQTIHSSPSNQSSITTPDSSIYPVPFGSNDGGNQTNGKRSNKSHLETNPTTGAPFKKKAKHDATIHQKLGHDTETTTAPLLTPTSKSRFTAASFQTMTRQQMVDRLIILENERIDLLRQLEQGKNILVRDSKDSSLVPVTADSNDLASSDMVGKSDKTVTGDDDDDDDDDDDEGAESEPSTADVNLDGINSSNVEMKCLWKDCGIPCIGGPGLTDHIIATHIGGGKSLYRCEWENCQRNQKPFTKRHKLCNHLRRHSGERPFVCDKAGCDKRFSRPDYLITHIKTHSNVRPFICHIPGCDKAYYHARSLKKHLKLHDDQKVNKNGDITVDGNNSNINLATSYAPNITTASTGIKPTQQQKHLYPFQEELALQQFVLQSASNATTSSMHNKQPLDPLLYDPSHSLFNPLAFQDLSSIQTPPLPQQQFTQMNPTSHVSIPPSMANTNANVDMMNQSNTSMQLPQQSQQQSIDKQQNEYNIPLFL